MGHNFDKYSDLELLQLVKEIQMLEIPENAFVRKVVKELYGEIDILTIQIQYLLWPLLETIAKRMESYSPHIGPISVL